MAETTEPRALTAALAGPAFTTKTSGLAMHAANRHVERWAPEAGASRVRPLRNLGFVDRLVSPWVEAAQRSASMRLFSQVHATGLAERNASHVSWVFPRPWYQDELDWMAASRQMAVHPAASAQAPSMLTTRGTYVAPAQAQSQIAMPAALYEYVAPSLSVAPPARGDVPQVRDAYSPLVPFAAVNAAQVMQRAVAPLVGAAGAPRMSPGLRAVLTSMLERSAQPGADERPTTRLAAAAPELVTPPAPRPEEPTGDVVGDLGAQRAQLAELQRAAQRMVAERVARETPVTPAARVAASPGADGRQAERQGIEERIAQRLADREREQARASETQAADARARTQAQAQRADQEQAQRELQQAMRERAGEQRLHGLAREAAARDARSGVVADARTEARTEPARVVPPEIVAAIANLSPDLASVVASGIAQRPERAVQTIREVGEALRTVELIARSAASGGTFENARGPRLVMPAGLGGLVAAVEHNIAPAELRGRPMIASQAMAPGASAPGAAPAAARVQPMRVPALAWLAPAAIAAAAPTTALGAAEAAKPAALHHVAWADRWLARFAGARGPSLDLLAASAATTHEGRLQALAHAAPDAVFVAPRFDGAAAASPQLAIPYEQPVRRFDDHEATPDDVFTAITTAAMRSRMPAPAAPVQLRDRESLADAVAHAVPSAPGAGLSAQLASSPFAPAFRHVLPLATAPAFDVRALFGDGLSAAYLAGLLAPASREITTGAALAAQRPAWRPAAPSIDAGEAPTREALAWDPAYVAPTEDARATSETDSAQLAGQAPASVPAFAGQTPAFAQDAALGASQAELAALAPALTTMRSRLLSWDVESFAAAPGAAPMPASSTGTTTHLAQSMIDTMAMPMLGELTAIREPAGSIEIGGMPQHVPMYAAPGMIADRAHAWSVAQERSSADLAFDFVTPELVLAARVYGLGPSEAAQAMRLAIAGPSQLASMASAVDRTFVQALAIEAERRDRARDTLTAYPLSDASADARGAAQLAPGATQLAPATTSAGPLAPGATAPLAAAPAAESGTLARLAMPATTFGVDRRAPRGAFMWPSATIAALGLSAASPDGEQSMSVAALELLAAQAVAELGTYAALGLDRSTQLDETRTSDARMASDGRIPGDARMATDARTPSDARVLASGSAEHGREPAETDVLATATALVPAARRAKFEAMYVALGASHVARTWSPAARAARALAIAGRGDESITAYERAQAAWDVLPVVAPIAPFMTEADGTPLSTGAAAQRAAQRQARGGAAAAGERATFDLPQYVESRPGLASLSARAGEALTSFVAPAATPAPAATSSSSREREQGAVMRAPTAAQELVRTGRPAAGRFGGGEPEIPTWFESAARKMLEDRSGGAAEGISLAELTLVSAAPSTQIAASTRGVPSAAPTVPNASTQGSQSNAAQHVDIEKVANEVYKHILVLMDAARFRNGEPYL